MTNKEFKPGDLFKMNIQACSTSFFLLNGILLWDKNTNRYLPPISTKYIGIILSHLYELEFNFPYPIKEYGYDVLYNDQKGWIVAAQISRI